MEILHLSFKIIRPLITEDDFVRFLQYMAMAAILT